MNDASASANDSSLWYRILVDDPGISEPARCNELLKLVLKHAPASVIAVAHFEGLWLLDVPSHRMGDRVEIFRLDELDQELEKLSEIIWGRFYLLNNPGDIGQRDSTPQRAQQIEQRIAVSTATICVADNSYYFVFTTSPALVAELLTQPWPVEVLKNTLPNLLKRPEEI